MFFQSLLCLFVSNKAEAKILLLSLRCFGNHEVSKGIGKNPVIKKNCRDKNLVNVREIHYGVSETVVKLMHADGVLL